MDLNPPKEVRRVENLLLSYFQTSAQIKEILLTTQGQVEDRYSLTVLHEHDL
jgi:hypothetical protein